MEFPFGHNRHHRQEREEEDFPPPPPSQHIPHHHQPHYPPPPSDFPYEQPPPPIHHQQPNFPPPPSDFPYEQPPPPPMHHNQPNFRPPSFEQPHFNIYQPPVAYNRFDTEPPPSYPSDQHVSHNQGFEPDRSEFRHHHQQHGHSPPSIVHHQTHEGCSELSNKPTVRVYTKAELNYSLTVRDDKVVLARSDPNDEFQHWIKDLKYSTRVKDEEGFPSFALVNKATGQAIKHSIGATQPVQLVPYKPDVLDQSVLWTESRDLGDTYRTIRMVNNIRLNLDAFNGDKNHGGVHDGTVAVLWEWKKGDNQRWKIAPYWTPLRDFSCMDANHGFS